MAYHKPFPVFLFQALLVVAAFWLGGLVYYAESLPTEPPEEPPTADGIVALTGGSGRLDLALDLLRQGKGQRLLISGVDANLTEASLRTRLGLPEQAPDQAPETPRNADTGETDAAGSGTSAPDTGGAGDTDTDESGPRPGGQDGTGKGSAGADTRGEDLFACCIDVDRAENTIGNASEIADWADRNDYESLIIVTASYHLPRSLLEIRRALPDVEIVGYPVVPKHVKIEEWYVYPGTAQLLAAEYTKYLASLVRLRLIEPVMTGMRR